MATKFEITVVSRLIHNFDDGHYGLKNTFTIPSGGYLAKREGFIEVDLKMPSIYEFQLNLEARMNPILPSPLNRNIKITLGYSYNVQSGDVSFKAVIPKVYHLEGNMKKQKINISSKTLFENPPHMDTQMLNWKFVGENDGFKKMDYEWQQLQGKNSFKSLNFFDSSKINNIK